jgi:hypothetical protein
MTAIDYRIVEQFDARAPFALRDATVLVLATIGSHSHNTYVPPTDPQAIDDVDYMMIVVPPMSYTLGIREWEGLNFQFEELDVVVYSFRKFVRLLLKANPNVLGLLWLAPESYVVQDRWWRTMLNNRTAFSSKHAYHSYIGYAHGQMQKMESFDVSIRAEWKHAVAVVEACGWTKDEIVHAAASRPMPRTGAHTQEEIDAAVTSLRRIHARHFQGYMGEKRKALVEQYGFDTKNAAHLIRLMRMCNEFLSTGVMQVFRTDDADHIRAIKRGAVPLAAVKAEAAALFDLAKVARDTSPLPDEPDVELIDALVQDAHLSVYGL